MVRSFMKSVCLGLVSFVVFPGMTAGLSQESERPIVGAIRWDGWFADSKWSKNLEPAEYHHRLPFYTTWRDGKPVVNADQREVVDQEMRH